MQLQPENSDGLWFFYQVDLWEIQMYIEGYNLNSIQFLSEL